MKDKNTEQLVERAKNGDKAAMDELYRQYSEPLLKFVMKQGLNEFDAKDVVSDTFVEVIKHIDELRENSYFSTWVHTIAKRKVYELKAKDAKHQRISFDTSDTEDDGMSKIDGSEAAIDQAFEEAYGDTVMLPADYAENEDLKQIIAEQIQSLSPTQRESLFLFYYQNKSVAEISELTGSSQNTVKVSLHNARKSLKKKLEDLQEKGIVLCAIPFTQLIPQFGSAFDGIAAGASAGEAAGAGAAESSASATAASASAGTSGTGIAGAAAAKIASVSLGMKIAAAAIAAVTIVGISAAVIHNSKSDDKPSKSASTKVVSSDEDDGKKPRAIYHFNLDYPDHHNEYMQSISDEPAGKIEMNKTYTLESGVVKKVEDENNWHDICFFNYNAFDNGFAYSFLDLDYYYNAPYRSFAFVKTEDGKNWSPIPLDSFTVKSSDLTEGSNTDYSILDHDYYVTLKVKNDPDANLGIKLVKLDSGSGVLIQYIYSEDDPSRLDITDMTWAAVIPDTDHNIRLIAHDNADPKDNFLYGLQLDDGTVYDGTYEVEVCFDPPSTESEPVAATPGPSLSDMTDEEYEAYIEEQKAAEKEAQEKLYKEYEEEKNATYMTVYRKSDGEKIFQGTVKLDPDTMRPSDAADAVKGKETFIPAGMPDLDNVTIIQDSKPEPEPEIEPEPERVIPTVDDLTGWQKAYYDYIQEYAASHSDASFGLVDMNGDGRPELFTETDVTPAYDYDKQLYRSVITSNGSGDLNELTYLTPDSYYGSYIQLYYTGKSNVIMISTPESMGAHGGVYVYTYYEIDNGVFKKLDHTVRYDFSTAGITGDQAFTAYTVDGISMNDESYKSFLKDLMGDTELLCANFSSFSADYALASIFNYGRS